MLINCGIPAIESHVSYVNDNEFNKYIKRYCEDLANQSWQTLTRATPMCEYNSIYKQNCWIRNVYSQNEFWRKGRTDPSQVYTYNFTNGKRQNPSERKNTCPFCREIFKSALFHLLLVCNFFQTDREILLPQYFCNYPNLIKLADEYRENW